MGGVDYWVEANVLENGLISLVATGRDGSRASRQELLIQDGRSEVDEFAVFAAEQVTLRKYCMIDSYDRALGSYASQVEGDHARDDGNVGSNGDLELSQYARVYGIAQHGPDDDDSITFAPNVTLWDGFGPARSELELRPIAVPSLENQGDLDVGANEPRTLGPGELEHTSLTVRQNASLTVVGPCELVITESMILHRNASWTFDTTDGPIRVYAQGDFRLHADATVRTTVEDPARLAFLLCGEHDSPGDRIPAVDFAADAEFHGTVYAPGLSVRIENRFELFGRVTARWVDVGSGARVHFDESSSAGARDPGDRYGILAWRPLTGARMPLE
jgi:hypothetical protein